MRSEREAREAAEEFRRDHCLGCGALGGDLISIIEEATGIDVAVLSVSDADQHGLTMRDPRSECVFIAVAASDRPMRQRSTIAHEVSHVVFGDWRATSVGGEQSAAEKRADTFARHLLIPLEGLEEFVVTRSRERGDSLALCSAVVQHFLVSPQVAAIAMHDAKLVSSDEKASMMSVFTPSLATRFGWMDYYRELQRAAQRTRAPQRLLARATAGYAEGVVSMRTIATLRGVSITDVAEELAEAGVFPPDGEVASLVPPPARRDDPEWIALLDGIGEP